MAETFSEAQPSSSWQTVKIEGNQEKDHPLRRKLKHLRGMASQLISDEEKPRSETDTLKVFEGVKKMLSRIKLRLEAKQCSIVEEPLPAAEEDFMFDEVDPLAAYQQKEDEVDRLQRLLDTTESHGKELDVILRQRKVFFSAERNRLAEEFRRFQEMSREICEMEGVKSVMGPTIRDLTHFVKTLEENSEKLLENMIMNSQVHNNGTDDDENFTIMDTSEATEFVNPSFVIMPDDYGDPETLQSAIESYLNDTYGGLIGVHNSYSSENRISSLQQVLLLLDKMEAHVEKCVPHLPYDPELSVKRKMLEGKRSYEMSLEREERPEEGGVSHYDTFYATFSLIRKQLVERRLERKMEIAAKFLLRKMRSNARMWERRTDCLRNFQILQQNTVMNRLERQSLDVEISRSSESTSASSTSRSSSTSSVSLNSVSSTPDTSTNSTSATKISGGPKKKVPKVRAPPKLKF